MKQIIIITTSFIVYITSFAAQHMAGVQACIGTPELRHAFEQMQHKMYANDLKNRQANSNKYPKISKDEINQWIAKKMSEIEASKMKHKEKIEISEDGYSKSRTSDLQQRIITGIFIDDLRRKYYPKIKTITCYPPQLLLEGKK